MKALVTGGAGFIGSNLVQSLLSSGHQVRVLDNFATGRRENLDGLPSIPEVLEGDIRSFQVVKAAALEIDTIFHLAALPSVPRSIQDPLTSNDVNVVGTLNVLQAARDAGVRRVVFSSSSSIYGDTEDLPKHEGMTPAPLSPYAVSKLAGEEYCNVFARLYGLQTISLRYFNVFGPRQDPRSQYSAVIPKFISAMLRGEAPVIFGDGEQSRDFTFVSNVVTANILAATLDVPTGSRMNTACHGRITLNELVAHLNAILGTSIKPVYRDRRPGDILHSYASIDRAKSLMGYEPAVEFAEGLRMTVDYFRGQAHG